MNDAPGTRRLLLMRHAKAAPAAETDHGRDLSERGRHDAAEAGRWLARQGYVPTHALVSSAARTVQTWQELASGSGSSVTPVLDDALYDAGPDSALEVIRAVSPEAGTLVVIGHNPTVAYLSQLLSDGLAEASVLRETAQGHPPCALTVFEVTGAWSGLAEGGARVVAFHVGQA